VCRESRCCWYCKIITISKGNYIGTSKGMEGEAFQRMLNWLEEKGLMAYFKLFVCDQDSLVLHQQCR